MFKLSLTIGSDALMLPLDYASRIQDYQSKTRSLPKFKTDVRNAKETVEDVVVKTVKKIEKTVEKVFHKSGVDPEEEPPPSPSNGVDQRTKP